MKSPTAATAPIQPSLTERLRSTINTVVRRLPPWVIYLLGFGYAALMFLRGVQGALGPDPIEALELIYGKTAFQLLLVGLAVTPIRQLFRINLLPWRRAIGVVAFGLVLAHFLVWAVLDVQTLTAIWADIVKRPYVTIGMASFVLLIPLAATSNNLSIRKLTPVGWRRLHMLVYPAALLGAIHYMWLSKGFQLEPLIYLLITIVLLASRLLPRATRAR